MAISTGVGFDLNFERLEQQVKRADEALAKLLHNYETLAKRINTQSRAGNQAALVGDLKQLRELDALLKKINSTNLKLGVPKTGINNLRQDIDGLIKYVEALRQASKQEQKTRSAQTKEALKYSKNAKSINDLRQAIKMLAEARNNENLRTKTGRQNYVKLTAELMRQKQAYASFTAEVKKSSTIMSTFGSKLGMLFSVSAIRGYINQLIQVRGEFEMMNRSLQVLLQNKDEADKLWAKTVQLAVKSPFTVKQLVTYTKQLAAYRVESDKLYETNRRLADISAGLGVDMNRLILAYGQVKAANYLRGTELRQFSEAGVNMLGELADRFTQLEGRVVSVGDVFQRVSKRLVSFEDVDAVIRSLTDRGGLFYKMQEEQSETLRGQIMNLRDSLDLMFNDIGKANDGVLKNGVAIVRELVNNWKSFKEFFTSIPVVIMAAVTAMNKFGASAMATRLGGALLPTKFLNWFDDKQLNQMIKAEMAFKKTGVAAKASGVAATVGAKGFALLKNAMLALSSVGIMAAITAVIYGLYKLWDWATKASRMAERLNESLAAIGKESLQGLNDSLATFSQLTDTLTDSTKSYTEHQDALNELRRTYKDILPAYKLTEEYIVSLKGNYDELTSSIIKYYQAREYEKKYQAVLDSDYMKDLQEEMEEVYTKANKEGAFGMIFPERQVKEWAQTVATELATGELPRTLDALRERTQEIFGESAKIDQMRFGGVIKDADMLAKKMGEISLATIGAKNAQEAYARSLRQDENANRGREQELLEQIEKQKSIIKSREDSLSALSRNQYAPRSQVEEAGNKYAEAVAELERLKLQLDDVYAARAELIAQNFKEEVEAEIKTLTAEIEKWWDNEQVLKSLERQGKKNTAQYETFRKEQDKIVASANQLAEEFGTEVPWAMIEAQETTHDLGKVLKTVATSAFPTVAQKAIEAMSKANEAILVAKGGVLSFVDTLIKILPTDWAEKLPDVGAMLAENDKQLAALRGELTEVAVDAEEAGVSIADIYSDRAKANVEKFGADMNAVNKVLKKGADTPRQMAENLRNEAKELDSMYQAYSASTNKSVWLEANQETEESMALMEKNIKALNALAQELWGETEKGGKGGGGKKDPWVQIFTQRIKAVQDFYNKYETVRKKFNEEESQTRTKNSFADYFAGVGIDMQKVIDEGWDTEALVANLEEIEKQIKEHFGGLYDEAKALMAKGSTIDSIVDPTEQQRMAYALAKLLADLQKDIADNKIKIDFELQENAREQLNKDFEELFDRYDLTKELKELGFTDELALAFGFETLDLDGVRKEITDLYNKVSTENPKLGKEAEDDFKKSMERITALENKAMEERIKNYGKHLTRAYSESATLQLKYFGDLTKVQEDYTKMIADLNAKLVDPNTSDADKLKIQKQLEMLPDQAKRVAKNMRKEMEEELQKLNVSSLLKGALFSEMFQDLGSLTSSVLDQMLSKIQSVRDNNPNLSLEQIKELANASDKILSARVDVASIRELSKYVTEAYKLRKKGITPEVASDNLTAATTALENLEQQIEDYNFIIGLKEKGYAIDNGTVKIGEEIISLTAEQQSLANQNLQTLKSELAALEGQEEGLSENVQVALKAVMAYKKANAAIEKQKAIWQQIGEAAQAGLDVITSGIELFGGELSDADQAWVDFASQIIRSCITLGIMFAALGVAVNSALGIIGIIATALTVVASLFNAILGSHDAAIQEDIEAVQKKVEKLKKTYEDLEEKIDEAWSVNQIRAYRKEMNETYKEALEYQRAIVSSYEDHKKIRNGKTKSNKYKEYEEELEKLRKMEEAFAETEENIFSKMTGGILDDIVPVTEDWVGAWLDAFKETGDGLSGLEDSFDELFLSILKRKATLTILNPLLEGLQKDIDKAYEDLDLSTEEGKAIYEKYKGQLPGYSNMLENLFKPWTDFINSQKGSLTALQKGISGATAALQKGISGATAEQAEVISSYLNSIRMYVATNGEQLKEHTKYLKNLWTFFDKIGYTSHPGGGYGLRVVI